ncbi:unnamed protein product [Orchesella dallaii]|uniref:RZ-type domain-containing protein n=1 Tax=Orchesella dallaii TaxID=48710 RepID=A0ABP1QAB6_9HEXA
MMNAGGDRGRGASNRRGGRGGSRNGNQGRGGGGWHLNNVNRDGQQNMNIGIGNRNEFPGLMDADVSQPQNRGGGNRRRPYNNDRRGGGGGFNQNGARSHNQMQQGGAVGSDDDDERHVEMPRKFIKKERKFEGPVFGFKKLLKFLGTNPDEVVLSINKDKEDWEKFLESDDLHAEKLILTIQVIAEKVCADVPILKQQQASVITAACHSEKFMKKLMDAVSRPSVPTSRRNNSQSEMYVDCSPMKVINSVHQICEFVVKTLPHLAVDSLNSLLTLTMGASLAIDPSMCLLNKFKDLQDELRDYEIKTKTKEDQAKKRRLHGFDAADLVEFDQETPPDDIKDIDVIPTIDELCLVSEAFLRPNKTSGAYIDANHYLDVQFRLLREDFVRPLRKGVKTFLKDKQKFMQTGRMPLGEVRLYTEVSIKQVAKERDSIVYKIQLSERSYKKVKWDKSKRLLPGSLLVFTTVEQCFKDAYFAVVFNRNTKELEKGVVTVTWEGTPPAYDEGEEYLMLESEVYLEACRHTLETLKTIELGQFPMKKFIVDACSDVEAPHYLRDATSQLKVKLRSGEERYIAPLRADQWPSAVDFGLDDNQFLAFQAAITNEFTIIQGPPGTGKTFLGLKVAQVLLSNAALWKGDGVDTNPITVVCYTNHALDQFLEGILNYYTTEEIQPEIIRIGGRCKSEALAGFTLREVRNRNRRKLPKYYWAMEHDAKDRVNDLEAERANGMSEVTGLLHLEGIVDFEKLSSWNQIQVDYPKALWNCFQDLKWFGIDKHQLTNEHMTEDLVQAKVRDWFRVRNFPKNHKINRTNQQGHASAPVQRVPVVEPENDELEDDEDFDLDELLENRLLDDILLESETSVKTNLGRYLSYLPNCSKRSCEKSIKIMHQEIQNAVKAMDARQAYSYRASKGAALVELENRNKLLSEIFRLYAEQLLDLPDVTDLVNDIRSGTGAVHYNRLKMSERWALYFELVQRARISLAAKVADTERNLSNAQKELRNIIQHGDGLILKDCKVVGLTTTGAGKYNNLLRMMGSKIVIVEEAAEVLEAHIVTCITEKCEQLILIGDHRQLRPNPTVYELATKYNLDLSLFERMINNNLHCYSLKMQHRMRPDIADLVVGSIYDELLNHDSVKLYPDVKGVTKNVFFITHTEMEAAEKDSCSKSNLHEAKFLAGLCRYLVLQDYQPEQITVLTMYTGQMFLLKKEITNTRTCQGVRITCVDNFQGEENDIILLSLVRSNEEGNIGFLNIDNRICVALSRAKHGLYVIGNMNAMVNGKKKSKTWRVIKDKLEAQDECGESLELECQIHGTRTRIQTDKDFIKVPEGGCDQLCDTTLPCTHKCTRVCHVVDRQHKAYQCRLPCLKICENQLHPCKGRCFEKCPNCTVRIEKTLDCERKHKRMLPCHKTVDGIICTDQVEKTLPCTHKEVLACHVNIHDYKCKVKVVKKLRCEHSKELECHVDPMSIRCKEMTLKTLPCEHTQNDECWKSPETIKCQSIVSKRFLKCEHKVDVKCCDVTKPVACKSNCTTRLTCGHACVKLCHVDENPEHLGYECKKDCSKECEEGHKCKVKHHCYKPCPPCKDLVKRVLPCGHQIQLECHIDIAAYDCLEECQRILPDPHCRHKCQNLCFQPCGPCTIIVKKRAPCGHGQDVSCNELATKANCLELVTPTFVPACGHRDRMVPSVPCKYSDLPSEQVVLHCRKPCRYEFSPGAGGCGHICKGTCSSCFQSRLHVKCQDECGKQLVCGHVCDVPCSTVCPPCKKPCFMKCEHSACKKKCGDPCSDCKEKCTWSCSHAQCTKLCGEMCDREPCNEPCPKKLKCGHSCVGFCGEPCPPLCRDCDKEELTEVFLGNEEDDDARFIYLEDCGHTIELKGLEYWLCSSVGSRISAKTCPKCKTTIRNCRRFANLIRQHYKDVMTVKMRSFGNRANSNKLRDKWIDVISKDQILERVFPVFHARIQQFLVDVTVNRTGRTEIIPKNIDEFAMRSMDFIADGIQKEANDLFALQRNDKLVTPFFGKVTEVYRKSLGAMLDRQPLSKQEIHDFNKELDRIDYYKQLMMRRSLPPCNRDNVRAYPTYLRAKQLVTSTLPFTPQRKQEFKEMLKDLDDLLRSGLGISDRERKDILQAMGMGQGHWFKCPNGHVYLITECGGAMQESVCNECGARIGGGSHRLRDDNQLASEMDGAHRSAWPGGN